MKKQSKKDELGRELTQARRDAEQRAKVERREAQEKAMFESISQMRIDHALRRRAEEEEDERFAALVQADAEKFKLEIQAEKQRKKDEIVRRRAELDALIKRDSAIKNE